MIFVTNGAHQTNLNYLLLSNGRRAVERSDSISYCLSFSQKSIVLPHKELCRINDTGKTKLDTNLHTLLTRQFGKNNVLNFVPFVVLYLL